MHMKNIILCRHILLTADIRKGITALDLWRQRLLLPGKETSLILKRLKAAWIQEYNAIAKKSDCVLLPRSQRRKTYWRVPRKKRGVAFGFGQSNVWFARGEDDNKLLSDFLDRLKVRIDEYDGENWIDKYAND